MVFFFFFKQKAAYEMRISDWSSDVCSSDLVLADQLLDLLVTDLAGAEGGDRDRSGVRHADRVAHLHFAAVGDAGGDDVLRHVARGVGGRTIDLGRILARERTTAMADRKSTRLNSSH